LTATSSDVHSMLESLIVTLVQARRCTQIYPRGNNLVVEAYEKLAGAVGALGDSQGGSTDSYGRLACHITRNGFELDGKSLGSHLVATGQFARALYLAGGKGLWFRPGLTKNELQAFIRASIELERAAEAPTELQQDHIGVVLIDTVAVAAPIRLWLAALVIGVVVSMFQAATQINEMTLSFIPKLLITLLVMVMAGPWILRLVMDYTLRLFHQIPGLIA